MKYNRGQEMPDPNIDEKRSIPGWTVYCRPKNKPCKNHDPNRPPRKKFFGLF